PGPRAGAHERPARAEARDEDVQALEGRGDLGTGSLVVRPRVRVIAVLEGNEPALVLPGELERHADGAVRALLARRVDDLGPEELQQPLALLGHALGHDAGE